MNWISHSALALLLVVATCLGGCAAPPSGVDGSGLSAVHPPPDFMVDATILSGDPDAATMPAHLRTSRYVLMPDGSLWSTFEDDLTADTAPMYVRTLRMDEISTLWRIIQNLGILERGSDPLGNPALVQAQENQFTSVIVIHAGRQTYTIARTRRLEEPPDPALRTLTRSLAALAFVSDAPDPSLTRAPIRYDFGPDPYARYRQQQPPQEE